jgi:hypothetical protein
MTTAAPEAPAAERAGSGSTSQLPLFEGFRLYQLEVGLGGKVTLPLEDEEHRAILKALKLGAKATLTIEAGGLTFKVDAKVSGRSVKLKRQLGNDAEVPTTACTLRVLDDRKADEEPEA